MKQLFQSRIGQFLFIFLLFASGFTVGVSYFRVKQKIKIQIKNKRYRIARRTHPILENKQFTVVIKSYNSGPWIEKNLLSVLKQQYDNYRVIYIDDASTDGSAEKVKQFIDLYDPKKRVTFVENFQNEGAMHNLYHAVHSCKNGEIVVVLDGDDFLADPHVLSTLNAYYANPDVWMTYGTYMYYPFCNAGRNSVDYSQEGASLRAESVPINLKTVKKKGIRGHPFVASHLRTFYAGLFKRIKLQDFLYDGKFLSMTSDVAFMLPMIELSGGHDYFVEDLLYLYNLENPISDFRKDFALQKGLEYAIKALKPYPPLAEHPKEEFIPVDTQIDLIVFSDATPSQLQSFLESWDAHAKNLNQIFVLYHSTSDQIANEYKKVQQDFPHAVYIENSPISNAKPATLARDLCISPYIVFAKDDNLLEHPIDFRKGVQTLEQTGAHGFYYSKNSKRHLPISETMHLSLGKGVYAWQFSQGEKGAKHPCALDVSLFRKKDALPFLIFDSLETVENLLKWQVDLSKVGLYYHPSSSHLSLTDQLEMDRK